MVARKDDESRARRNAPVYSTTNLIWDGVVRGPELGDCPMPNAILAKCDTGRICPGGSLKCVGHPMWSPQTYRWWEKWRRSPQSMVMTDLDWDFLMDTAIVHHMLWSPRGNAGGVSQTQLAAELRQRIAKFGATYEDRLKLNMLVETPQSAIEASQIDEDADSFVVDYATRLAQEAAKN